jgi:hypothetical protein
MAVPSDGLDIGAVDPSGSTATELVQSGWFVRVI